MQRRRNIIFYFCYYKRHAFRDTRIWWLGEEVHPTRTTWSEKLAFPECCRLCLRGDSAGTGLAEGERGREGRSGRGHHQKELAHAQYGESAIHSLSTGPFLSSLLSTAVRNMNKRDEVVLCVCWKTMNWSDQIISEWLGSIGQQNTQT